VSRAALGAALVLVGACKKSGAPEDPIIDFGDVTPIEDEPMLAAGRQPVGPGRWNRDGWSVFVPPGWSGDQGDAPHLLSVTNQKTGVGFALWVFDVPLNAPRSAEDEVCDFVNTGRFRTVPVLGLSQSATCTGADHVRQAWWSVPAHLGPAAPEVHVEAIYPTGRTIRGRQDVAPMLEGLTYGGSVPPATEPREE
jgi:hypothetical protein